MIIQKNGDKVFSQLSDVRLRNSEVSFVPHPFRTFPMPFGIIPPDPSAFSAEYLQQYQEQGYVRIPGFLDAAEVAAVRENLKRVIAEVVPTMPVASVIYEDKGDTASLKQLINLHQWDDFFEQILLKSRFFDLAEFLLGRPVAGRNMQYFNKPPAIGAPTPPHQDGYYWKISPMEGMTMWLALEKVDEANGCVRYIPGSQLNGPREHGRTATLGFSQGITDYDEADREQEVCMNAEAGDLLIHESMTIHRADGNESPDRSRQALGLIYFAARARQDTEKLAEYQANLTKDMLTQGKL